MSAATQNNIKTTSGTGTSFSISNDNIARDASNHYLSAVVILHFTSSASVSGISGTYNSISMSARQGYNNGLVGTYVYTLDDVPIGAKTIAFSWTTSTTYYVEIIIVNTDGYDNSASEGSGFDGGNTTKSCTVTSQTNGLTYSGWTCQRFSSCNNTFLTSGGVDGALFYDYYAAGASSVTYNWRDGYTGENMYHVTVAVSLEPATLQKAANYPKTIMA
jgi:hypothetical protein